MRYKLRYHSSVAKQTYYLASTVVRDHPSCTHASCRTKYEYFVYKETPKPCFRRTKELLKVVKICKELAILPSRTR
jgi:hypothetical protein